MKEYAILFSVIALIALACAPAFATFSGLIIIPTADMVGDDQYAVEFQVDGPIDPIVGETWILNTQFGFGDRWEAGVDFDLSEDADPSVFLNAKYLLWDKPEQALAVAIGTYNVARDIRNTPYIVATKDFGEFRFHLGGTRTDSENRWFVGADAPFGDKWTLMADYTSGEENFSSAGFNYQFNDFVGLMAGLQFPNDDAEETLYTLHLVLTGAYAK